MTAAAPSQTPVGPDQTSRTVPGTAAVVFGRAAGDQRTAVFYAHALHPTVALVVHHPSDALGQMAPLGATSMFTTCEELADLGREAVCSLRTAIERNGGELRAGPLPGVELSPQAAPVLAMAAGPTGPVSIGHRTGSTSNWWHGS